MAGPAGRACRNWCCGPALFAISCRERVVAGRVSLPEMQMVRTRRWLRETTFPSRCWLVCVLVPPVWPMADGGARG
eukprot:3186116-Prymnesium_polylepis.1